MNLPLAIVFAVIGTAGLVALVGGLLHAAGQKMPQQSDIEPGDLKDDDTKASVAVELASLGFNVKSWGSELQITDIDGLTFYMPKSATLEQCLERYGQKNTQFKVA